MPGGRLNPARLPRARPRRVALVIPKTACYAELHQLDDAVSPSPVPPQRRIWMRTVDKLPDSPQLHAYLLAYASDYSFVTTALQPHGVTLYTPGMQVASIDHVMWFHRPLKADEWLLYHQRSPSAQAGRGLAEGFIFRRDGALAVTVMPEGLIRPVKPDWRSACTSISARTPSEYELGRMRKSVGAIFSRKRVGIFPM